MKTFSSPNSKNGFTLIELLVVIAIIALLSSVVMSSTSGARQITRDTVRISDMHTVQTALEMYYNDHNSYPTSSGLMRTECASSFWWLVQTTRDNVIPGLTPTYMATLPRDPMMIVSADRNCYLYTSDGNNYKFIDWNLVDADYFAHPTMNDPMRQWGSWAVYSQGGISF